MRVFYYQYEGVTYVVCVSALDAGKLSPIWRGCNTCSWLVIPRDDEDDEGDLTTSDGA